MQPAGLGSLVKMKVYNFQWYKRNNCFRTPDFLPFSCPLKITINTVTQSLVIQQFQLSSFLISSLKSISDACEKKEEREETFLCAASKGWIPEWLGWALTRLTVWAGPWLGPHGYYAVCDVSGVGQSQSWCREDSLECPLCSPLLCPGFVFFPDDSH